MSTYLSALQLVSESSPEVNLDSIKKLLIQLSPQQGQLVLLPENALCFADKTAYLTLAEQLGTGAYQQQLAALALQYKCYLICGSFPIRSNINNRVHTTSLVYSPDGQLIRHYHKIHLFDALVIDNATDMDSQNLASNEAVYKESDTFVAGDKLQLFDWKTAQGNLKVGLAICYDLRFPGLFQSLRAQGADILLLPAAFTKITGEAHWLPLLRARAIETQCYIVAANQGGTHPCGRETYGHSMIISPWGEVLDELDNNEGIVSATCIKQEIEKCRTSMPITTHNRFTSVLK